MIANFGGEYRFLSNFYYSPVIYEGITYPTVEHAYQAAKTLDQNMRKVISLLSTPKDAKAVGGEINTNGTRRNDWLEVSLDIMEELVRQKFSSDKLSAKLIATGDEELVEGNWWNDTFWGVCNGIGENNLGKILMKVRAELVKKNLLELGGESI